MQHSAAWFWCATAALLFASFTGASSAVTAPWGQLGHDAQRTGRSQYDGSVVGNLKWRSPTSSVRGSAALVDGLVVVGSLDGRVRCLNGTTGAVLWTADGGPGADGAAGIVLATPAIDANGTAFMGTDGGTLLALIVTTGRARWNVSVGGPVWSSVALGPGHALYVGAGSDVLCVDADTGSVRWRFTPPGGAAAGPSTSSPTLTPDGGALLVGAADSGVWCLNATTGALLHRFETGSVLGAPTIRDAGIAFVASMDYHVYALDALTGRAVWTTPVLGPFIGSAALGPTGTIFVGTGQSLLALDPASGRTLWTYATGDSPLDGRIDSAPAVSANNIVFVASGASIAANVHAVNGTTGLRIWRGKVNGTAVATPAIAADGSVILGSFGGFTYAFGL